MKQSERGVVALLSTIILSLLLIVITVSLVSLEVAQLRKSVDSEQSLRAYYAAEAGMEDAVSKILSNNLSVSKTASAVVNHECIGGSSTFDIDGVAGWTCQRVSYSGSPAGKLDYADQSKTIDAFGAPAFNRVVVQWNKSPNPSAAYFNAPGVGDAVHAPPIEVGMLRYPTGGFASTQVCVDGLNPAGCTVSLRNMLIVPSGGAAAGSVDYGNAIGAGPWAGNCTPGEQTVNLGGGNSVTGYNCYAVISNFSAPGMSYLLRIRSRFSASAYQLTFLNGNNIVPVDDGSATIDVTARAGETYRRVVSKLPMSKLASSGLNYVIYSDSNICKNFLVIDEIKQPGCF